MPKFFEFLEQDGYAEIMVVLFAIITSIITVMQFVYTKNESESLYKSMRKKSKRPPVYWGDFSKIIESGKNNDNKDLSPLLNAYHKQALLQSNIQFGFSLFFSAMGFIFILLMIYASKKTIWYEYIPHTLPGTVIEVVSLMFFKQARETRDSANDFFRELNHQQRIEMGIKVATGIDDSTIKSEVKARISLHLVGIEDFDKKESLHNCHTLECGSKQES